MAKKKVSRRKKKFTIPVSIAAPIAYVGYNTFLYANNRGVDVALDKLSKWMTGFSVAEADFNLNSMKGGALPILTGVVIHKVANMTGLNRALSNAGIPIIRI